MSKSVFLIRIPKEDKDAFYDMCDMKALNPSEVIRRLMAKFCMYHYKEAMRAKAKRQQMK